jgi:hypothetical protein
MAFVPFPLAINSYKARSGLLSSERLVNMYVESSPAEAPFNYALYGTPGLKPWVDLGVFNPVYGIEKMGNDIYVVCGVTVYKIDSSKTVTTIGTMGVTPGRVMMTNNGTQVTILIESGKAFYCTSAAASLVEITDGDYVTSGSVDTVDGFTMFTNLESRTFQISELNTTESYLALDFANVLSNSTNLVRVASNNLEAWMFKKDITLVYYNSGSGTFPFARKNGVLIQKGCAAKHSVATMDNSFFFLGNDKVVYGTSGYQLVPISTHAISKEIESYGDVSDAFSFTYIQEGHKFYNITFPTANKTWVYDLTTKSWHERESLDSNMQAKEWRANCHVLFNDLNIVGDNTIGKLYELDLDTYDEDGTTLISKIVSTTQFDGYRRDGVAELALVMDTGVGINSGQGITPEIMMRTSTNGGKTWSNELKQPLGAQGDYETEVFYNRVAFGRSMIIELKISDPVKRSIIGSFMEVTRGQK